MNRRKFNWKQLDLFFQEEGNQSSGFRCDQVEHAPQQSTIYNPNPKAKLPAEGVKEKVMPLHDGYRHPKH